MTGLPVARGSLHPYDQTIDIVYLYKENEGGLRHPYDRRKMYAPSQECKKILQMRISCCMIFLHYTKER